MIFFKYTASFSRVIALFLFSGIYNPLTAEIRKTGNLLIVLIMLVSAVSISYSQESDIRVKRVMLDKGFLSKLEAPQPINAFNKISLPNDVRIFFVINFEKQKYDTIIAVLKSVTENAKIWVDTMSIINNHVTSTEISEIAAYLELKTYEGSKNSLAGILPLMRTYFGNPPNVDENRIKAGGDGKTNILITDIKDGLDNSGEYIPGYFNYEDVDKNGAVSNEMDLLYIDSSPGIFYKGSRNAKRILPTLAHEFQHLIHWNHDPKECVFLNEGLSLAAEVFCGFRVDLPEQTFTNTNISLFDWNPENIKLNESRAALFTEYVREQCGDNFIRYLISSQDTCAAGIDSALVNADLQNYTFEKLLMNWSIANYVNDKFLNSKYGYNNRLYHKPVPAKTHLEPNVLSNFIGVNNLAPVYIKYSMAESLTAIFHFNKSIIVKALEIGNSSFRTYEISANNSYVQNNFGTQYKEIVFICLNLHRDVPQMEYVNYTSSGKRASSYAEILYDDGVPENFGLSGEAGVKRFVRFRIPPGKQLDSARFGFKTLGRALFHLYKATDTSVVAVDNIISPIMMPVIDTFPKWTKVDLTPFKIIPDFDLAAGYEILPGDAPHPYIWGDNSIVYDRSIVYFPSTGSWHSININYLIRLYMSDVVLKVEKNSGAIPDDFKLFQNYPNPFNGATTIKFDLNKRERVRLRIYDLLGKEVITLADESLNSGSYSVKWYGKNKYAVNVPSGLYIYSLETSDSKIFKKMVYLK